MNESISTFSQINLFSDEILDTFIVNTTDIQDFIVANNLPSNLLDIKNVTVIVSEDQLHQENIVDLKLETSGTVRIFTLRFNASHPADKFTQDVFLYHDVLHTPKSLLESTRSQLGNQGFTVKIDSGDFSRIIPEKYLNENKNVNCILLEFNTGAVNTHKTLIELIERINAFINKLIDI